MGLEIDLGNHIDILDSGSVIQFKQQPVKFRLKGEDPETITIDVRFAERKAKDDPPKMQFVRGDQDNYLILMLSNFDNSVGHGNIEPVKVGILDNRELFFSIRVFSSSGATDRIIHYTFYLGEEVTNG